LHDHLGRLQEVITDEPAHADALLRHMFPNLVRNVIDVLEFTSKLKLAKNEAVVRACQGINATLLEIVRLRTGSPSGYRSVSGAYSR
jgi:hypothetical protein